MAKMKGEVVEWEGNYYRFKGGDSKDQNNWEMLDPQKDAQGRGTINRFVSGAKAKWDSAAYGLKDIFTDLSDEEKYTLKLGDAIEKTPAGAIGSGITEVAATWPLYGALGKLTGGLAPVGRDLAQIFGAGAIGASTGALTNPGDRQEGAKYGGLGALGGAATGVGLRGLMAPGVGSYAEVLQKQGVPLTAGMASGHKGMEDTLRAGSRAVGKRQAEAMEKWSQNEVNQTMPPVGTAVSGKPIQAKVGGTGRDAIKQGADAFDDAYGQAYGKAGNVVPDNALTTGMDDVLRNYSPKLLNADADMLAQQVNRIKAEFSGPTNGRAVKDLVGTLERPAQEAFNSGNQRLGEAYRALQDQIKGTFSRQYPDAAKDLSMIDPKYAEFLRVQRAAGKTGANDGVFSPNLLRQAIRDMDKSKDKRAFARGTAMPEMLSRTEKAGDVLGPTIPPVGPGTAEKLIPAMALQNPWLTLPYMATNLAYQPAVQKQLTGGYQWQQGIDPMWLGALGQAAGGALK